MAPTTIFLTGATGYIGGAVLALLLEAPNDKLYKIAALVRSHQKAPLLEALGVRPVLGSLADLELLEKEARENDATIHTANADDLPAIQAILKGLIAGGESGGKKKVLIHTSGTGVLTGMYAAPYTHIYVLSTECSGSRARCVVWKDIWADMVILLGGR